MEFIADLHVHSKYSRATAKNLDLENLYIAAQLKGVTVVGTGDFTYPAWFSEICEKLEPAEPGLFKLKKIMQKIVTKRFHDPAGIRFVLFYPPKSAIYTKKMIKPAKIIIWF
jgi:PHP family Zn ribbon phosphoesterase